MDKLKKIFLLVLCSAVCSFYMPALSAEDFSFDLDSALNDSDKKDTDSSDGEVEQSSSSKAIYPTVDAQSYFSVVPKSYSESPVDMGNIIEKYKAKNYVGCIQEAQAKIQQDNPNPVAMYYMALAYTQIGDVKAALDIYDAILKLQPSETLRQCAVRGRDCLIGGSSCPNIGVEGVDIDAQVNEYKIQTGKVTGFSAPVNEIIEEENDELEISPDIFVSSDSPAEEKIVAETKTEEVEQVVAQAPNDEEIANAIKTLQNAGMTFSVQPSMSMPMGQNYNSEMAQLNMLLGNNNNQNRSFDMLPYMMAQSQGNSQYNPQMMQAMMMNYMLPSLDINTDNNK